MLFFGKLGFHVVVHERRGHGHSDQTWHGPGMHTCANDLATLLDTRDVKNVMMGDHSTGGGEVVRYLGRTRPIAHVEARWSRSKAGHMPCALRTPTGSMPTC